MEGNSDIVRRAFDAWNRADWDAVLAVMDPELELDASARVLNPMVYRGRDGFMKFAAEVFEVWKEWRMAPEELIEVDDRVFAAVRSTARGRTSGLELDEVAYQVWTVEDGQTVHIGFHYDRDEALAAAGHTVAG